MSGFLYVTYLSFGLSTTPSAAVKVSTGDVTLSARPFVTFVNAMSSPHTKMNDRFTTITGEYSYVGNPCTTQPCLPGMIYAVFVNGTYYHLTSKGHWLWENQSWDGYMPEVNEVVSVTGVKSESLDIVGVPFHNIEVESLVPVK